MFGYDVEYFCEEDGYTYCYDFSDGKWFKVCTVETLPEDIKKKIQQMQNSIK